METNLFLAVVITVVTAIFWQSELEWRVHNLIHNPKVEPHFSVHLRHHLHFANMRIRRVEGDTTSVRILTNPLQVIAFLAVGMLPFGLGAVAFHHFGYDSSARAIIIAAAIVALAYYFALEGVHVITHASQRHAPHNKWLRWLSERHSGHHDNSSKNFNTVIPFGDWVHGTLHR